MDRARLGKAGLTLAALLCASSAALPIASQPGPQAAPLPIAGGEHCARLQGKTLGGARIDSAESLGAGAPAGATFAGPLEAPVALCRVRATISPVPDSTIKVELWLPADWNGKLVATGGGGLNGGLGNTNPEMSAAVAQGYAGVIGDSGHESSISARWAIGHPEKIVDFGPRGNHLTAIAAKAIVAAHYGKPARRSYFQGCSGGGREALMLAQRHPGDYDGIAAGAPAADLSGLMTMAMWNSRSAVRIPEAAALPKKLGLLHAGAVRQCDKRDGIADGVIADPRSCKFDPAALQCKPGADTASCLTAPEVEAARGIYAGATTAAGLRIMAGPSAGSETGWAPFITEKGIGATVLGGEYFRWIVHQDADWSAAQFQLDADYAAARSKAGPILDATSPDLRAFARRGGKLLIYHGWEDPVIPALATLDYYKAVRRRMGEAASRSVRLFMMPGVAHCSGGNGPSAFDRLEAIDRWVEKGEAPDRIVLRKYDGVRALQGAPGTVLQSRPVCAWPRIARYNGRGSTDDAANFTCQARNPE